MAVVLVVDSDPDTRNLLRVAFEFRGHTVLEARDSQAGLRIAGAEDPDVIIGDFPLDVPGHSPFTKAARAAGSGKPLVISFSARTLPHEIAAAVAVSDVVLTKPASPFHLVRCAEELLRGHS
jgi:DNA-binding response OmpR family regulator